VSCSIWPSEAEHASSSAGLPEAIGRPGVLLSGHVLRDRGAFQGASQADIKPDFAVHDVFFRSFSSRETRVPKAVFTFFQAAREPQAADYADKTANGMFAHICLQLLKHKAAISDHVPR
jgi:hypothetical protein